MRPRTGPRRKTINDDPPDFDFLRDTDPDALRSSNALRSPSRSPTADTDNYDDLEDDPDVIKSQKDERTLARHFRSILPVRVIGGSCIMSLPKGLRTPLDIKAGDRLLVELDTISQSIVIKKDSSGNRQRALKEIDNLKQIWKLALYIKRVDRIGDPNWCRRVEKTLIAIVKHLKGEILDRAENDDGEDL